MKRRDEILKFSLEVETLAIENDCSILEAILEHCLNTGVELEMAPRLLSSTLKEKLFIESLKLNLVKGKKDDVVLPF